MFAIVSDRSGDRRHLSRRLIGQSPDSRSDCGHTRGDRRGGCAWIRPTARGTRGAADPHSRGNSSDWHRRGQPLGRLAGKTRAVPNTGVPRGERKSEVSLKFPIHSLGCEAASQTAREPDAPSPDRFSSTGNAARRRVFGATVMHPQAGAKRRPGDASASLRGLV